MSPESTPSDEDIHQWIDGARSLRALMQSDPHRPGYHIVAPEGAGMPFDPVAGIFWKGRYHLGFSYQKRPASKIGDPFWTADSVNNGHVLGHLVSTDLLHWTQYPDMLGVSEEDDEIAVHAAGAFLSKDGVPHIIYMGIRGDGGVARDGHGSVEWDTVNRIARAADDDLKVWKRFSRPALTALDPQDAQDPLAVTYTPWDPEAWYDEEADAYFQISGGMRPALFRSDDLQEWTYIGDLIDPDDVRRHPEEDVSGLEFISLGTKSMVLFMSHQLGTQYYIGTFADGAFSAEQHGRWNGPGGTLFSPEHLRDETGRNIVWAWVVERRPPHSPAYGWSGILCLPRVLSLGDDGILRIAPAAELEKIRTEEIREDDVELPPHSEHVLRARGRSIEVKLEISGATTSPVGVKVFASPDGREETVVVYDPVAKELAVDFSRSSVAGPVSCPSVVFKRFESPVPGYPDRVSRQQLPLDLRDGESLMLDVFLDRSVIEVFANGVQCLTQVVYPELENSTGVTVFSGSEPIAVRGIRSWTMSETTSF